MTRFTNGSPMILPKAGKHRPTNKLNPLETERRPIGTLILALLAGFCISLLRYSGTSDPIWLIAEVSIMSLISCSVALGYPTLKARFSAASNSRSIERGKSPKPESPTLRRLEIALGIFMVLTPWVSRWLLVRYFGSNGEANELVALAMLQYGGLWQAAFARSPRQEWLSFLISCFLVLFGLASSDRSGMIQVVIPFTLLASWWLMARYWEQIEEGYLVSQSVSVLPVRLSMLSLFGLVALAVVTWGWWNRDAANRLDGFMPTSGGNQQAENWARQGVGDGDMLIAAQDEAFTFGPVDSELFLESEVPSMYDLANDIYGEATPKQRKYARAISLNDSVQEMEKEGTESKKNSKEFSAVRQPKGSLQAFKPKGNSSKAVAYVIGEAPQWLRLESYDHFEDNVWSHSTESAVPRASQHPSLVTIREKPWMEVQSPSRDLVFPVRERLAVKLINLKSPRLLTPSLVTHLHIDKIDQEDFFSWMGDGQLMMPNRDFVPQLTVVHQMIQTPRLHPLRTSKSGYSAISHGKLAHQRENENDKVKVNPWLGRYLQLPDHHQNPSVAVSSFLEQVRAQTPPDATDWQRIESVVRSLRTFKVDANAALGSLAERKNESEKELDAIDEVLSSSKGTDYLIATAAAVLIRQMGIPARLSTGFFVSPNRFDRKSGQTEVLPEDLHTWAEVYVHGIWLPIEPSGSYPMPREYRTWQQWAIEMVWACRDLIRLHPIAFATCILSLALFVWIRRRIATLVLSLSSLLILLIPTAWLPPEGRLRFCLWFLRCRMWFQGEPVEQSKTVSQWLKEQLRGAGDVANEGFIRLVHRVAYGPERLRSIEPENSALVTSVLRNVILSSMRSAVKP